MATCVIWSYQHHITHGVSLLGCAGHWKLGHTPKNFVLSQVVILAQMSLFTFTRTAPGLFESFGFIKEQPVFMSIVLFQLLQGPIDEVRTQSLHAAFPATVLQYSTCNHASGLVYMTRHQYSLFDDRAPLTSASLVGSADTSCDGSSCS